MLRTAAHALMFSLCALGLTGCLGGFAGGVATSVAGSLLEDDPPEIELTFVADESLNPNSAGESSSVVIRFYELSTDGGFNAASFFEIYQQDRETLGEELLNREEIVLSPGETKEVTRVLNLETKFLGIVAGFRDWENSQWRAIFATPIDETTEGRVDLKEYRMSLEIE